MKTSIFPAHSQFKRLPLTALLLTLLATPAAEATDLYWQGPDPQTGTNNWSDLINWLPNSVPQNGDSLHFSQNNVQVNNVYAVNDIAGLSINGIYLNTSNYVVTGLGITSTGNITAANGQQIIGMPITVGANQTWDGGGPGGLYVLGQVNLNDDNTLNLQNQAIINNASNSLTVGDTGTASLTVQSASAVNTVSGIVGNNAGSQGTVTVTGANSAWNNTGDLTIGVAGTGTLNVQSGGASNNTGDLTLGATGTGSLNVQSGGTVNNANGTLGLETGSNGTATITGTGSTWANTSDLTVGAAGTGNLTVTDGGAVSLFSATLGSQSGSSGTATVSGAGSSWTHYGFLTVGDGGTGTLNLQAGGTINANGSFVTLGNANGGNGTLTINGANAQLLDANALFVGSSGTGALNVQNGGSISGNQSYIGYNNDGTGTVTITGTGSTWTNTTDLTVGLYGGGTLNIHDNGTVSDQNAYLGNIAGNSSTATVDTGATWTNQGNLLVGDFGSGTLNIQSTGTVTSQNSTLGVETGSSGTATVSGGTWTNQNDLTIGGGGSGALSVNSGGTVNSGGGNIAVNSGVTGTVTVTDASSTWTNSGSLGVGVSGNASLSVQNGGKVASGQVDLAVNSGTTGTVTVTDANSTLSNSGELEVGISGNGSLSILNGGKVSNSQSDIAVNSGSTSSATVSGASSTWTNSGALNVGVTGTGTLNVQTGGKVSSSQGSVGVNSGAEGTATVNGTGSTWSNSGNLSIGMSGAGTLNVQSGGNVSSGSGSIGGAAAGTATVSGANSSWTMGGSLNIGNANTGAATLNVQSGGTVSSGQTSLGNSSFNTGTVVVTGAGSNWTNGSVVIGNNGTGQLSVLDGGTVTSTSQSVDYLGLSNASQGTATVDGANSQWSASSLTVGYSGTGTLNVQNGGTVNTQNATEIGFSSLGVGTVKVTGTGSTWINDNLVVGRLGQGTLNVEAGAAMTSQFSIIAQASGGASTGIVNVTGPGSMWTIANSGSLIVGDGGYGWLNVKNGGKVINNAAGGLLTSPLTVGNNASGSGAVTVDGAGSTLSITSNTASIMVGDLGPGSLTIQNGGTFTSSGFDSQLDIGNGGTGEVIVNGAGSTLTGASTALYVGYGSTGSLTVQNGGHVSNSRGILGYANGSAGTATVTGVGSAWDLTNNLTIGNSGSASLNINDSGQVNVGGALSISHAGAINLGGGTLNVGDNSGPIPLSGGASANFIVDQSTGAAASATISGTNSKLVGDNSNAYVGYNGSGEMTIQNGGSAASLQAFIGYNSGSDGTVTVTGTGSAWTVYQNLNLGVAGTGTMNIDTGAKVYVGNAVDIGQSGTLNLNGGTLNSLQANMNPGSVLKGFGMVDAPISGGDATSLIQASGGDLALGSTSTKDGFNYGGVLDVGSHKVTLLDQDLAKLGSATTIAQGGQLEATHGILLDIGKTLTYTGSSSISGLFTNNGQITALATGDKLEFLNDVTGTGGFAGDIHFHAAHSNGSSPGMIDFHGSDATYHETSKLILDIFGTIAGTQYDQLLGLDQLFFAGGLDLNFGNSYAPMQGDIFHLFNYNNFDGLFDPSKINVIGFNRSYLDFSWLSVDGTLRVTEIPLPEPASNWLFLTGLGAMLIGKRRRLTV